MRTNDASAVAGRTEAGSKRPVGPVSDRTPLARSIPSGAGLVRPVEDRSYGALGIGPGHRPRLQSFFVGLLAATLLAGCGSHADSAVHADGDGHDHAAEAAPAVLFKAGRGLQLGATAAQFIGLATAEVAARDLPGAAGAPAIPESALLRTVRGEFVFVANGGWYLRTPVQTGAVAGGWIEIRDGLYEGDTVVAQGARALWLAEIQAVNGGVSCTHGH